MGEKKLDFYTRDSLTHSKAETKNYVVLLVENEGGPFTLNLFFS